MKAPKAKRRRGRPKTHGLSRTRAYRNWHWITYCSKQRYFSEAYYGWPIYLCKEWQGKKGMIRFYEDMGERPTYAKLQVRDVTQPFSKTNCYWETRPEELTKEQSTELIYMMRHISDHSDYLDRWERGFCKRMNNYLKRGCPISIHCFVKIKDIFENLSTLDRSELCTITDDYAGGAPMYSSTPWKDVEDFLKTKELERIDALKRDCSTGTRISDKTLPISGQGDNPPPATKKGGMALQTSTPWEYNKFLAAMPRRLIDLNSVDRQSYIYDKFWAMYGQGPIPPFATKYDERCFQQMKRDAGVRQRYQEYSKGSKEKERQNEASSLDRGNGTSKSSISDKTLSISPSRRCPPPATKIDKAPPQKTPWERLLEYEKEREGNLSNSCQAVNRPPAITIDNTPSQTTNWELEKLEKEKEEALSLFGQEDNPPLATSR